MKIKINLKSYLSDRFIYLSIDREFRKNSKKFGARNFLNSNSRSSIPQIKKYFNTKKKTQISKKIYLKKEPSKTYEVLTTPRDNLSLSFPLLVETC